MRKKKFGTSELQNFRTSDISEAYIDCYSEILRFRDSEILPSRGFTLVELAVVIAVAALIIGSGIGLYTKTMELENYTTTEEKLLYIAEAINNYKDSQAAGDGDAGAIPKPSDPSLKFGDTDFGLSNACAAAAASATVCGIVSSGNFCIGGVPTRTLKISPSYAIDAWNRRITYAMDTRLTSTYSATGSPDLTVSNIGGDALASGGTATGAAVVLVSHGANGFGACRGRGSISRSDSTSGVNGEDENADGDSSFVQSPRSGTYDDITYYILKWQLKNLTDRGQ